MKVLLVLAVTIAALHAVQSEDTASQEWELFKVGINLSFFLGLICERCPYFTTWLLGIGRTTRPNSNLSLLTKSEAGDNNPVSYTAA